jgi:uncharacterized protein (DUF1800 family)
MQTTSRVLIFSLALTLFCGPSAEAKKKLPTTVTVNLPAPPRLKQIQGDQRILHALDRLTLGPRPGDLEEAKSVGLDAWIAQQLHPATIDDFALEQRLDQFPAMRLTEEDLTRKFPPGSVIRQVENGKISVPLFNAAERAIYENQLVADRKKQEQDKAKAANLSAPAVNNQNAAVAPPVLSATEVAKLLSLAPGPRMAKLLSLPAGEYAPLRRQLSPVQRTALEEGMSPEQRETLIALDNPRQVVQSELLQSRVLRAVYSRRQLQEVMTDFWLNHFNVFQGKTGEEIFSLVPYERDAIRPNALGSFEALLFNTATSTAMMTYLDNAGSTGPHSLNATGPPRPFNSRPLLPPKGGSPRGLNENYARELMELHTLGVNGGYTQRDVTEVAKVFTGWTVEQPPKGGPRFVFDESRHEPGVKHVLGVEIKENGFKEGLEVLHILATSPATAHFICRKLAVRFVSDTPPQSLVDRLSTVFLVSNGNIGEVMRFLVQAPEFWSVTSYRAKIKTPEDFVISAVRAGGIDVQDAGVVVKAISDLGQPLYGRQTPDGYSMLSTPWVNSGALLERMNFSLALAGNRLSKGVTVDWLSQLGTVPLQPEEQELQIENLLLHGQITENTRNLILQQLASTPPQLGSGNSTNVARPVSEAVAGTNPPPKPLAPAQPMTAAQARQAADRQAALTAGLLFGSPDFQRR